MRLPVTSESDAFRLAYGLTFVVAVSLLLGYLLAPIAGIGLVAVVALAALRHRRGDRRHARSRARELGRDDDSGTDASGAQRPRDAGRNRRRGGPARAGVARAEPSWANRKRLNAAPTRRRLDPAIFRLP